MRGLNRKLIRPIICFFVIVLVAAGVWTIRNTENLSAATKTEQKASKKKANQAKEPVQQYFEEIAPLALPSVVHGKYTVTPKVLVLNQGDSMPRLNITNERLKVFDITPNTPRNSTYSTENGDPATYNTQEVGFQIIYVRIEVDNNEWFVVPVPMTVTNANTIILPDRTNPQIALQTDGAYGKAVVPYIPDEDVSEEAYQERVREAINPRAWRLENNQSLEVEITNPPLPQGSLGEWTIDFDVADGETAVATATQKGMVFGAKIKATGFLETPIYQNLAIENNAANIFDEFRTLTTDTDTGATYEWVTQEGTATEPVNTFIADETGYHMGYIKMTSKVANEISNIIPVKIAVTDEYNTKVAEDKFLVTWQPLLLKASELQGKTQQQITDLLTEKGQPLTVQDPLNGSEIAVRTVTLTQNEIDSDFRGSRSIELKGTTEQGDFTMDISVTVTPDALWKGTNLSDWEMLPKGSTEGIIINPINESKLGYPLRGINSAQPGLGFSPGTAFDPNPEGNGFMILDKYDRLYVKDGRQVADIPGVMPNKPLYADRVDPTINKADWWRTDGLGYGDIKEITSQYYLKKGNELKQILVDEKNDVLYVYDLNLQRNLNFRVELNMYNTSSNNREFAMLETANVSTAKGRVIPESLGEGVGFYFPTASGDLFSIKLKDNHGEWLSDYRMYTMAFETLEDANMFRGYFDNPGFENVDKPKGAPLANVPINPVYQLGAPYKMIPFDQALKTGYEVFSGEEISYMELELDPEEINIYANDSRTTFDSNFTLGKIPNPGDYGNIYITYPDNSEEKVPFQGGTNRQASGILQLNRNKFPQELNPKQGTIKEYKVPIIAVNETEGDLKGLPSEDELITIKAYHLGAQPVAQTLKVGTPWVKTAKELVTDPVILPGHEAHYEFVDGEPDTSEVGLQMVEVKMTDKNDSRQETIIKVPVNIVSGTPPTTGITLFAQDILLSKNDIEGLDEKELETLVIEKSNAVAWDNATGLTTGITISVDDMGGLTANAESDTNYQVSLKAVKESNSDKKEITVTIGNNLHAEAVAQTITLGTDVSYWTSARLQQTVKDVQKGEEALTNYTVQLVRAPTTDRITNEDNQQDMVVRVTEEGTNHTLDVTVPVNVAWGNSFALGGSGTIVGSPNAESTLALTIHEDATGPYLTSTYGNLPIEKVDVALDQNATGTDINYQITYLDMSGKEKGLEHATELYEGLNLASEVDVNALNQNTPKQMVNALTQAVGQNGKIRVHYGDILRVYTPHTERGFYYQNSTPAEGTNRPAGNGPLRPLEALPNDDTSFIVVTEDGFVPLYLDNMEAKDPAMIPIEATETQATYQAYYDAVSVLFDVPENGNGQYYRYVVPAGYKAYPKLNMALGEESDGVVYTAEPTLVNGDVYVKYAYTVKFKVSEPNLYISEAPDNLSFGTKTISSIPQMIQRQNLGWGFVVKDNRENRAPWIVTARMPEDFYAGEDVLKGAELILINNEGKALSIDGTSQEIFRQEEPALNNSVSWTQKDRGFFLKVPSGRIKDGAKYKTKVEFEITDAPTE